MKKHVLGFILSWITLGSLNAQVPLYGHSSGKHISNLKTGKAHFEIPETKPKDKVIHHAGYSLLYNEAQEQASWVAYELTDKETIKLYQRTNKFIVDPAVKTGSATQADYKGSGYDRGHLAPAADMGWSALNMQESFYYSNMSPQEPGFNRGIWKNLEEKVRGWAFENKKIYIVTGPVLRNGLHKIGPNQVAVPEYFYKVILDYSAPSIKGIAFLMPNHSSTRTLQSYAVSIDSVEKTTGINFFPNITDAHIESTVCIPCWSWEPTKHYRPKSHSASDSRVQCSGITKKGNRCKRMTADPNGNCYQHQG
jgi:endonuclease G